MPGLKRKGIKKVLKIIEWAVLFFWLTGWEKSKLQQSFRIEPFYLRRFYAVTRFLRSGAEAYNAIPLGMAISLQGSLFSWLILSTLATVELHPMMIGISFGGGLSAAITLNSVIAIVRRIF